MRPWLMPIQDNIDFLLNGKKGNMDMFFDDGTIQIEALTYIRGRSIANAYIIIDESQQLTQHEIKTILTRIGENTNKTHPRFKRQYPDGTWASHMHAEMNVLRFARPGDELEVIRFENFM